jgi:hypothetical protein
VAGGRYTSYQLFPPVHTRLLGVKTLNLYSVVAGQNAQSALCARDAASATDMSTVHAHTHCDYPRICLPVHEGGKLIYLGF